MSQNEGRFAGAGMPGTVAIVLAGGSGRRLGGVDKAALELDGQTLLDRALHAVSEAVGVVVVGPERDLPVGVQSTQEHPVGGGPVAAVAAGLAALDAGGDAGDLVVVLACDMPFVDAAAVRRIVTAARDDAASDGVAFVDGDGRRQHLAAAYRTSALRSAITSIGSVEDAAMRDLASRLTIIEIEADPETTLDCDTWPDVERTRAFMEERRRAP